MGVYGLKQLNYDVKTIILQNVKIAERPPVPEHYTKSQYRILCKLIIQKRIEKRFFDFILSGLFNLDNWKNLNYSQMYTLIYVLANYDYKKGGEKNG